MSTSPWRPLVLSHQAVTFSGVAALHRGVVCVGKTQNVILPFQAVTDCFIPKALISERFMCDYVVS